MSKGELDMRKIRIIFAAAIMAMCMSSGTPVLARDYIQCNINDGDIDITKDGDYHITGNGTVTSHSIVVKSGVNAYIKLENVKIKSSSAFKIEENSTGNVHIELVGENSLISDGSPGIWKDGDGDNIGTLTISGSGSLRAENCKGDGAGIGSSNQKNTRNIVINGGTITARAGTYGAGIGGGGGGGCAKNITINGGDITAIGGTSQGAGIGGGSDYYGGRGYAENITITGGIVKAIAQGTGAGIGGGYGYGNGITITGGTVTATGGNGKADIGGNTSYTGEGRLVQTIEVRNNSGSPATNNMENALTYDNGRYSVKGKIDLDFDLTVHHDETLEIMEDAVLTVNSTLINDGSFENHGTILEPNGHVPREDDGDCTTPVLCKACQGIAVSAKAHQLSELQQDDTFHWYYCENDHCTQIIGKESHQAGDWVIDKEATVDQEGQKHKECTVCHYVMETETIAKKSAAENSVSVDSTAETDTTQKKAAKTGDESEVYTYMALMITALAGCSFVLRRKKLQNKQK